MKIQQIRRYLLTAACAMLQGAAPVAGEDPVAPFLASDAAAPGVRGASPEVFPGPAAFDASSAGIQGKVLSVTVVSAANLEAADLYGSSDTYVKVKVYKEAGHETVGVQQTEVIKSLNPTWNTELAFPVPDLEGLVLKLMVMDEDADRLDDDEIGECEIYLEYQDLSATPKTITKVVDQGWFNDETITVSLKLA